MTIPVLRDLRRFDVLLPAGIVPVAEHHSRRVREPRNTEGARERVMELRSARKAGQTVLGFSFSGYGAAHSSQKYRDKVGEWDRILEYRILPSH